MGGSCSVIWKVAARNGPLEPPPLSPALPTTEHRCGRTHLESRCGQSRPLGHGQQSSLRWASSCWGLQQRLPSLGRGSMLPVTLHPLYLHLQSTTPLQRRGCLSHFTDRGPGRVENGNLEPLHHIIMLTHPQAPKIDPPSNAG